MKTNGAVVISGRIMAGLCFSYCHGRSQVSQRSDDLTYLLCYTARKKFAACGEAARLDLNRRSLDLECCLDLLHVVYTRAMKYVM
jgi:hypothetical protein